MRSGLLAVLLAGAAAPGASAQPPSPSPAAEVVVLKAARMFDGKAASIVASAVVIVEGDRKSVV